MTETAAEVKKVRIEVPGPEGANPEVFEGATETEVLQKIVEAKGHATAKIREQQQQLETAQRERAEMEARLTPAAPPTVDGFDRDAYFNTLYADPEKAFDQLFERRFSMTPDEATSQWQRMSQAAEQLQVIEIANKWKLRHPELLQDLSTDTITHNSTLIDKIRLDNELPFTEKGLEAAYALALQSGKLKLPASNAETAPPSAPATLTNNGGSGDTVDEATLLAGMTLDQRRQYYSTKAARLRQGQ